MVVTILDVNDQSPKFEQEFYEFSISESARVGSIVGTVVASDLDLFPYNHTELFIVAGNEGGEYFGLKDNGELFVKSLLDIETKREHQLKLLATDSRYTTSVIVKISVKDENDNAPLCELDSTDLFLPEDVEVGSAVFTMVADDADSGEYAILNYHLLGSQDFSIDENGILIVARPLDRESVASYSLIIRAVDNGNMSCETAVSIVLTDINDTPPKFTKDTYEVAVKENLKDGPQFLIRVKADDADLGSAGKVQYALVGGTEVTDLFWMDEISGALTVAKPLDRESQDVHKMTVIAMDQDPVKQLSGTAEIIVRVLDVNDNPPEFVRSRYSCQVSEEEGAGFELLKVEALSKDASEEVKYILLAPGNALDVFELDSKSGALKLRKQLDYEEKSQYMLTVEAVDSGSPPLSAQTRVNVSVIDANDNPPKFTQAVYEGNVPENTTKDTKIIQVAALDLDSGLNGKVNFKFLNESSAQGQFIIDQEGWLVLVGSLDREVKPEYRLVVEAEDSGERKLTDNAVIKITVTDVNDNPPVFSVCNLTATVKERMDPGFPLLDIEVEDADAEGNGAPFTFSLTGDGAEKFAVEPDGLLVTTEKLRFRDQHMFLLTVVVIDSGNPRLSSECPLTVEVVEESKHPPELISVTAEVNSYLGEFPGGLLARANATDKDPRDRITYGISSNGSLSEFLTIDLVDGSIRASAGIPVGSYKVNISASDGKFTSYAIFNFHVNLISEDALVFAVSIRIRGVSTQDFTLKYRRKFSKGSSINYVTLVVKYKREPGMDDVDILFNVRKGQDGFYKPNFVKRRLQKRIGEFSKRLGLQVVSLTTEVCRRDLCVRGQCRERLILDDVDIVSIVSDQLSFVAPRHKRTFQCICKEGYGGERCNVPVNACSREPCAEFEFCVPLESAVGYECVCPTGASCQQKACTDSDCAKGSPMSFSGKSYLRYTLSTSLDSRLQLAVEIRTMASNGIIMTAAGKTDYNILELRAGYIQYRFDCGSGEGVVIITDVSVSDGKWHLVSVIRRGRNAELSLDQKFTAKGYSAGSNTVINLDSNDVYFGAEVRQHPTLYGYEQIRQGFTGCLNRIYVDGFELPRSKPGMRLYNVNFECTDTFITGVCSSQPCKNFGTCVAEQNGYSCLCHPRFTGIDCEMDLNPCASQPCTHGSTCENLYNDFFCRCTAGYTGKICAELGDFDECISSPCGNNGICINTKGIIPKIT